jgi:hypothetical protein
MDSRRSQSSDLQTLLRPILSGKAAFSSKNALSFLKMYSDAGTVTGVFFGSRRALARRACR